MLNDNTFIPEKIIQIGAGGTGSRICDEMRYFIRGNFTQLLNTEYTIVDHDTLSASNLNRQLYFLHEVSNKTKGQIMVERYRDMIRINQIPEPINADTVDRVFDETTLNKKLLVIVSADNGLVVKQVIQHLKENAKNDWFWIFTGANLVKSEMCGREVNVGAGQAYAYGVVGGTPLFPIAPTETLTDIMSLTGFGPTSDGQGCGVDGQSGAQTPLMNQMCATATMTIISTFFEQGIFIPSIYFVGGQNWTIGDTLNIEDILSNTLPEGSEEGHVELDVEDVIGVETQTVEELVW
jgi:hypothetical protein